MAEMQRASDEILPKHADCPVVKDWGELRSMFLSTVGKINEIHIGLTTITEHIKHLDQLSTIAENLTRMTQKLVDGNQVSVERALKRYALIITATILSLAVLVAVVVLKDSDKSIHVGGPNGVHVEDVEK